LTGLTFLRNTAVGVTPGAEHSRLVGAIICFPHLLDILQTPPLPRPSFIPQDGMKGHDNVPILTHPFWQSLFHGDPGAIASTIRVDDIPRQVIGVLPASFHFPNANALRSFRSRQPASSVPEPAVFLPFAPDFSQIPWDGNYGNYVTLGRLQPGISI